MVSDIFFDEIFENFARSAFYAFYLALCPLNNIQDKNQIKRQNVMTGPKSLTGRDQIKRGLSLPMAIRYDLPRQI